MLKLLRGSRSSQLLHNTGWMLLGQGLRIMVQGLYFVLIARVLGVTQYGSFVGVAAFVAILAPFASWGAGNVLIKNVVRAPTTFGHYWGAALRTTLISGGLLSALALGLARLALPAAVPTLLVAEVIVADLILARLVDTAGQAFQGAHRLSRTAASQFLISFTRLSAAAVLAVVSHGRASAMAWGGLYLGASVVTSLVTISWVHRELGKPAWSARLTFAELKEGFQFSVTNAASSVYNDIDKTMLARLATLDAAGFYAAAYRILDVSFVPIRSLLYAAYSRFFAAGSAGISGTLRLATRLLPFSLAYSVIAGVGIFVLSPIVPRLLGPEYAPSIEVLRYLAILPLLRSLHYFAADTLTGADRQGTRSAVQACVAGANVLLNLWLIPRYSWRGAIWSTLASDGLLAVSLWIVVAAFVLRARKRESLVVSPEPALPTPVRT